MKRSLFETLKPICPVCRSVNRVSPLVLSLIEKEVDGDTDGDTDGDIEQGILSCSEPTCLREYPIIDGIPLLIGDLRSYVAGQALSLVRREDLAPSIESVIGDCCGPGSAWDVERQHLSTYASDHYGDLDPEDGSPSAVVSLLENILEHVNDLPDGPVLDIGCSVGRTTFEMAKRLDRPVLGVDLHISMLRTARRVLTHRRATYPLRRVGLVYDRRDFPVDLDPNQVDFWACDALNLPFRDHGFSAVSSLNVLDCLSDPRQALVELARSLSPDGKAWLTTPYDWSTGATPLEGWMGGHSQRGPHRGRAEPVLRSLLSGQHPARVDGLEILAEEDRLPWRARLHDRSTMQYEVDMVILGRDTETAGDVR